MRGGGCCETRRKPWAGSFFILTLTPVFILTPHSHRHPHSHSHPHPHSQPHSYPHPHSSLPFSSSLSNFHVSLPPGFFQFDPRHVKHMKLKAIPYAYARGLIGYVCMFRVCVLSFGFFSLFCYLFTWVCVLCLTNYSNTSPSKFMHIYTHKSYAHTHIIHMTCLLYVIYTHICTHAFIYTRMRSGNCSSSGKSQGTRVGAVPISFPT